MKKSTGQQSYQDKGFLHQRLMIFLLMLAATDSQFHQPTSNLILDKIVGQGYQGGPVLAQFASRDGA